jgi:mono/diheme cytochrome c family protein
VLNAAGVIRYVRRPTGQMPAFTDKVISDQQLTDIYAYLKTFPAPILAKDIPLLDSLRR